LEASGRVEADRLPQEFEENLRTRLSPQSVERVLSACREQSRLEHMPVHEFASLFVA